MALSGWEHTEYKPHANIHKKKRKQSDNYEKALEILRSALSRLDKKALLEICKENGIKTQQPDNKATLTDKIIDMA